MGWGFLAVTISILTGCGSDNRSQQVKTEVTTNYTTLNVTNLVVFTNTVIVTNSVTRNTPVWAIPEDYVSARQLFAAMTNATFISPEESLFNMKGIEVDYVFSPKIKDALDIDSIKAKFELALRNNNVPMIANSKDVLTVEIDGFYTDSGQNLMCYSMQYNLTSTQWITRNREWHLAIVTTWTRGNYGTVGRLKASDSFEGDVTKAADVFANDYQKANPKTLTFEEATNQNQSSK